MAKFNEILEGRYNRFIQKLFSMKGGPPAAQLATEVGIQMQLFNGVENRYLEGWYRYAASFAIGPVAAQITNLRLRNPAGSNVIAVLEKVLAACDGPANDRVVFGRQIGAGTLPTTDLTASQQGFELDLRQGPFSNQNSVIRMSRDTGQSPVNQTYDSANILPGTSYDFITDSDHQITMLPGDVVEANSGTINQKVFYSVTWRERVLEQSERT
jgi:hypothetical protein